MCVADQARVWATDGTCVFKQCDSAKERVMKLKLWTREFHPHILICVCVCVCVNLCVFVYIYSASASADCLCVICSY